MSALTPEIKNFGAALDRETALGRLVTISKAFTFVWVLIISGRLFMNLEEKVPLFSKLSASSISIYLSSHFSFCFRLR